MAVLDQIVIGSANLYLGADRIRKEIRLGSYDGGYLSGSYYNGAVIGGALASKPIPVGGGGYLEVIGLVDPFNIAAGDEPWYLRQALKFGTEVFAGYTLRVGSVAELEAIAKRLGGVVARQSDTVRIPPDGAPVRPLTAHILIGEERVHPSRVGLPNFCCWEDRLYCHPSGHPVIPATGLVQPLGVAWLEVGGSEAWMAKWLGQSPSDFGMRFNGMPPGLYAVGINTDVGEVVLRRPSACQVRN